MANAAYYVMILEVVETASSGAKVGDVRDSDDGYLAYFSLYLAGLVTFRVSIGSLYILKWKCRYNCSKKYRVKTFKLEKEVAKMRTENGESTDDAEIEEELKKFYEKNKDAISNLDESILKTSLRGTLMGKDK